MVLLKRIVLEIKKVVWNCIFLTKLKIVSKVDSLLGCPLLYFIYPTAVTKQKGREEKKKKH